MGGYGMVFNLLKIRSQNRMCFKYVFFFGPPHSWPEYRRLKNLTHLKHTYIGSTKGAYSKKTFNPSMKSVQMSQVQLQVHPKASFSGFMGGVLGAVDSWTRGGVYVRVRWAWGPLSDQVWEAYSIAALFRCSYLPSYVTPSSSPTHLHIDMSQKKIFLLMHHHVHFLSHHCPSIQWVSNDEIRSDTYNSTLVVSHSWPR